jgi:TolA-binding protein
VQFRLAMLHFEAKDHMQAAVLFTGLLEDSLTTEVASAALYNLALCQSLLGQREEARASLDRYRTRYPQDERRAQIAYQLGALAESGGDASTAAGEYERALAASPAPALAIELHFRLGQLREQAGDRDAALRAYQKAAAAADKDDAFRLSAVARCAAIYEQQKDVGRAAASYRDIARNAKDQELVAAAKARASELERETGAKGGAAGSKSGRGAAD